MYGNSEKSWKEIFGAENIHDALAFYSLTFGYRHAKGAVPRGTTFAHLNRDV